MNVTATELAALLTVSKARVSQYVAEGKLKGCYTGDGRARRFDVELCRRALSGRLDAAQMMGNGADTRRALRDLAEMADGDADAVPKQGEPKPQSFDGRLNPTDPDRYELARADKAEQDARKARRDNEREEGNWVLAAEVERQTARLMAREVGGFETVLRDGARVVADQLGVDFRVVRQLLMQTWRQHRTERAGSLDRDAQAEVMTDAERAEDI